MSDKRDDGKPANRYTSDASRRVKQLRAIADEFPDDPEPRALTPMQVRLARHTSPYAIQSAASFVHAMPHLAPDVDVDQLHDAVAFESAYDALHMEAIAVARRIEHAILRRKLEAVKITRGLYRLAKSYATMDRTAEAVFIHVESLKRSLVVPRRRKRAKSGGKGEPQDGGDGGQETP